MNRRISVQTAKPYEIVYGNYRYLLPQIVERLAPKRLLWAVDKEVLRYQAQLVLDSYAPQSYVLPLSGGEANKTVDTYLGIVRFLAEHGFDRGDVVVAVGGGVVGDTVGFAAATYMRGIRLIHMPTTLLAMVDSSIGGKTGVDLPQGKNLLGSFYQPEAVVIDAAFLSTLPPKEWTNGMGECIKYGVLLPPDRGLHLLQGTLPLDELLPLCAGYKAQVVAADECDKGSRALLNLGHTAAHAIERLSGYTVPHGLAVAIGVGRLAQSAYARGQIDKPTRDMIVTAADNLGLPDVPYTAEELAQAAQADKKSHGDYLTLVDIFGLGDVRLIKVAKDDLAKYL